MKVRKNKRNNDEVRKIKQKLHGNAKPITVQCPKCGSIIGIYSYHINSYVFTGNYCENCGTKIDKQRYVNVKPTTNLCDGEAG